MDTPLKKLICTSMCQFNSGIYVPRGPSKAEPVNSGSGDEVSTNHCSRNFSDEINSELHLQQDSQIRTLTGQLNADSETTAYSH